MKCQGFLRDKTQCDKERECDSTSNNNYCKKCQYFAEFTEDEITRIKNGQGRDCTRCKRINTTDNLHCRLCKKASDKLVNSKIIKCAGKDQHGDTCRVNVAKQGDFCDEFHPYMREYTPYQMANLSRCSGCKKQYYLGENKTCDICRNRKKGYTETKKEAPKVYCKHIRCPFGRSEENEYCGQHKLEAWKEEVEQDKTKKVCHGCIRGCRNLLDINDRFANCQECRVQGKEKDDLRRNKWKDDEATTTTTTTTTEDPEVIIPNEKTCHTCGFKRTLGFFVGDKGEPTVRCAHCRDSAKRADANRSGRKRAPLTEEKKEQKKERKEERLKNNTNYAYELRKETEMNSRAKQLKEKGVDRYHKDAAAGARKWRQNNPEKVKESNEKRNKDPKLRVDYYKYKATNYKRSWDLTDDEAIGLFKGECYYCGKKSNMDKLLGIDRKDNNLDYIKTNCVTCCEMCNYMKADLLKDVDFINKCHNILVYTGFVNDYSLVTKTVNRLSGGFNAYKKSASRRDIEFNLTQNDFNLITTNDCYLCGKENNEDHINGVDRIDNSKGYCFDLCKACCSVCNRLKNNYQLKDLLIKMLMIYNKHFDNKIEDVEAWFNKNHDKYNNLLAPYDKKILQGMSHEEYISASEIEYESDLEELPTIKKDKITNQERQEKKTERHQQSATNILDKYLNEDNKYAHIKSLTENHAKKTRVRLTDDQRREKERIKKQKSRLKKAAETGKFPRIPMTEEERKEANKLAQQKCRSKKAGESTKSLDKC